VWRAGPWAVAGNSDTQAAARQREAAWARAAVGRPAAGRAGPGAADPRMVPRGRGRPGSRAAADSRAAVGSHPRPMRELAALPAGPKACPAGPKAAPA